MKSAFLLAFAICAAAAMAAGQPLSVYSEFARIDAQGNVVEPQVPREIISPAAVRNGFTSFQVVAQAPPGSDFILDVGQNPGNAARVTLYRMTQAAADARLEKTADPARGAGTQIFWMDVWIDKNAPVRRIKIEPQLFINGDWVIYPMEMRVRENIVPDAAPAEASMKPASPFEALRGYLCGAQPAGSQQAGSQQAGSQQPGAQKGDAPAPASGLSGAQRSSLYHAEAPGGDPESAGALHLRNARQDIALASVLSAADRDELRKRMGGCGAHESANPEFYLRLRDYFFTPPWMKAAHGN